MLGEERHVSKAFVIFEKQYLLPSLIAGDVAALRDPFLALVRPQSARPLPVRPPGNKARREALPFVRYAGAGAVPGRPPLHLGTGSAVLSDLMVDEAEASEIDHSPLRIRSQHPVEVDWGPDPILLEDEQLMEMRPDDWDDVDVNTTPRALVNVYPYGLVTCQLTVRVSFNLRRFDSHPRQSTGLNVGVPLSTCIRMIRLLAGHGRVENYADYYLTRSNRDEERVEGRVNEFLDKLARETVGSVVIADGGVQVLEGEPSFAVAITAVPPLAADDPAVAGFVMLEPEYYRLSPGLIPDHSLFGKKIDDVIAANTGALLVSANGDDIHPASFRRYTWNLFEISSAVRGTKLVLSYLASQAPKPKDLPDLTGAAASQLARAMTISNYLVDLPQQLSRHHRKWYRRCYGLMDLAPVVKDVKKKYSTWDQNELVWAIAREIKEAAMADRTTINITESNVGSVVTGTVIGNIQSHIDVMEGPQFDEVRPAFKGLAEAISNDNSLDEATKTKLLEFVEHLSGQAVVPEGERQSKTILSSILESLKTGLGLAATAGTAWAKWGPTILAFFGV